MKTFIKLALILSLIGGYSFIKEKQASKFKNLTLENVEAIASSETGGSGGCWGSGSLICTGGSYKYSSNTR